MGDSHHEMVEVDVRIFPEGKVVVEDDLENAEDVLWWSDPPVDDIVQLVDAQTRVVTSRFLGFKFNPVSWNMGYFPDWVSYMHMLMDETGVCDAFEGDDDRLAEIALRRYNDPEQNHRWEMFTFIVVYQVATFTHHDEFGGNDEQVEFDLLGELDFKKLPLALVKQKEGQGHGKETRNNRTN